MEQALQSANARVEELHRVLKQNVALQVGACMKLLLQAATMKGVMASASLISMVKQWRRSCGRGEGGGGGCFTSCGAADGCSSRIH